jgi:hypothetical protein
MGWAECRIRVDAAAANLTASYLSDALGDLCSAVIALLRGEAQARVSFEEEPGEYRWLFERSGPDRLRIRIREFEDVMDHAPDKDGSRYSMPSANCGRSRPFCLRSWSAC